jgi:hypothetical protein
MARAILEAFPYKRTRSKAKRAVSGCVKIRGGESESTSSTHRWGDVDIGKQSIQVLLRCTIQTKADHLREVKRRRVRRKGAHMMETEHTIHIKKTSPN